MLELKIAPPCPPKGGVMESLPLPPPLAAPSVGVAPGMKVCQVFGGGVGWPPVMTLKKSDGSMPAMACGCVLGGAVEG